MPEEFVQPAKKSFAVLTKLQLAGVLVAGAYTAKEAGCEKKQMQCPSFKKWLYQ
jgi:hypothetical protein